MKVARDRRNLGKAKSKQRGFGLQIFMKLTVKKVPNRAANNFVSSADLQAKLCTFPIGSLVAVYNFVDYFI